ncbi:MAG: hypothetical protein AABW85_04710 [archaeon]
MKIKTISILLVSVLIFLSGCVPPTPPGDGTTETLQTTEPPSQQPVGNQQSPPANPVTPPATEAKYAGINENAALYESLAEAGLGNALVDFQRDNVLIALELPQGYNEASTAYYALGLAAGIAEPEQKITVEIIKEGGNSKYSVLASKSQQFSAGSITQQQFESFVQKT